MLVELPSRIRLYCETFGSRADPPVLLLGSLGETCREFSADSFCRPLADQGFFVVRFDQRDSGRSSRLAFLGRPKIWCQLVQQHIECVGLHSTGVGIVWGVVSTIGWAIEGINEVNAMAGDGGVEEDERSGPMYVPEVLGGWGIVLAFSLLLWQACLDLRIRILPTWLRAAPAYTIRDLAIDALQLMDALQIPQQLDPVGVTQSATVPTESSVTGTYSLHHPASTSLALRWALPWRRVCMPQRRCAWRAWRACSTCSRTTPCAPTASWCGCTWVEITVEMVLMAPVAPVAPVAPMLPMQTPVSTRQNAPTYRLSLSACCASCLRCCSRRKHGCTTFRAPVRRRWSS